MRKSVQFRPSSSSARETKISVDCKYKVDKGLVYFVYFAQHIFVVDELMRIQKLEL